MKDNLFGNNNKIMITYLCSRRYTACCYTASEKKDVQARRPVDIYCVNSDLR